MGPLKQNVRRKLAFKTKTSAGCIFALQKKRGLKHSPVISAVAPPPPVAWSSYTAVSKVAEDTVMSLWRPVTQTHTAVK